MEKWKVGVSILRRLRHFSPVLWEEKLGRVKPRDRNVNSLNAVKANSDCGDDFSQFLLDSAVFGQMAGDLVSSVADYELLRF